MAKRIITEEDIELYPNLTEKGFKIGEEYDFEEESEDDDTGGTNPPPDKEKPKKP